MKKRFALLLCLVLAAGLALAGCGGYDTEAVNGRPDKKFAVLGNGSSAVQAGDYFYFINGVADLTDESGNSNEFGEVVKGGLYRARFAGGTEKTSAVAGINDEASGFYDTHFQDPYMGYYGEYTTYVPTGRAATEDSNGLQLETVSDYENKGVLAVDVDPIVKKKISSGIYVFGDWIYYASPNNLKNKQGSVQYTLTDFYRTRQNGQDTELLYTTTNPSVTSYGFYYYKGAASLFVLDGTNLVRVNASSGKNKKPATTVAKNVASAVFSAKPVWHSNLASEIGEDTPEDFVYFTRNATKDDANPTGTVFERIRPNGDQKTRFVLSNNGSAVALHSVRNGYVYYTTTEISGTYLYAHDFKNIPKTQEEYDALEDGTYPFDPRSEAVMLSGDAASLTEIYAGNQIGAYDEENDVLSATHFVLATKNASTVRIVYPSTVEVIVLDGVSAKILAVFGNEFLYTAIDGTTLYRANIFDPMQTGIPVSEFDTVAADHLKPAVVAGYAIYPSSKNTVYTVEDKVSDTEEYKYISNYMKIRKLSSLENDKEWELSEFARADIPPVDPDPDEDSDGDGIPDVEEDADGDGIPDDEDTDTSTGGETGETVT